MIQIHDKKDCCGCNACGDVCAHKAITFQADIEGFWYPVVDKNLCVDCGLCEKVCPVVHVADLKRNEFERSECYAAIHKNIETRFDSTSGGVFSALAEEMYSRGGYVGGAVWTEDWGVRHFVSSKKDDLDRLRSSKYLQSDAQGFYAAVRDLLKAGQPVLVCGTPCQMAALRAFLQKPYDNLIVVDFICRGVNSPKVWHKYLEYQEAVHGAKVVYIKPKNKEWGWRELTTKLVFGNGKVLYDTKETSLFTTGYLQTNVYCRPSCYDCRFKGFPRMADITVADLWGAEKIVGKELDNDMGTSLVMLNNPKGKAYFEAIQKRLLVKEIPFDSILAKNPALVKPLGKSLVSRDEFYQDLDSTSFSEVAKKYIKRAMDLPLTTKAKAKNLIRFGRAIVKASRWSPATLAKNLYYNFLCRSVNANVREGKYLVVHRHCVLDIHPSAVIDLGGPLLLGTKRIGKSRLESRLLLESGARIVTRGTYSFMYGFDIEVFRNAVLEIDGGGATNIGLTLICGDHIQIGERVMMGRNCTIRDNNGDHYIARRGYKNSHPVKIGQHAWLCEGCTLIAGARIGDGVIVGAKAVVSGVVPSFSLVMGNPAVVVDEDVYWKY